MSRHFLNSRQNLTDESPEKEPNHNEKMFDATTMASDSAAEASVWHEAPKSVRHEEMHMYLQQLRILLIEDDRLNQIVISEYCQQCGHDLHVAQTGEEAMSILAARPGDFDLVLCDVVLPDASGLQVLEFTRRGSSELIFLMLSGHDDASVVERSVQLGADAFLFKPIRKQDIQGIWQFVSRQRRAMARKWREALERVELEKDRQLISTLQHEEKNAHQAQELDADRASAMLLELESKLRGQRDIAHEYHPNWVDFYSAHEDACRTLKEAHMVLSDIGERARGAQRQVHNRIMLRQLAHDEYVPARSPVDVIKNLRQQLGHASPVELRVVGAHMNQTVDELPRDLLLDWNLLWHGLSNGVSNARKYGDRRRVWIELRYADGELVLEIGNSVDREAQARLIASHGNDGTHLLYFRGEGGTAMSTNMGSQALLACVRLLGGSVALCFSLNETRLVLKVATQRPASVALTDSLVVWFLDDDPTTRRRYQAAWLKPPLDPASRVLPDLGLSPEATDEAMRTFVTAVLAASPRPRALLLDQNLQSQVLPTENVTTGTEISQHLRKAGYDGMIVIRSANVSRCVSEEYKAAGADAVISKEQDRGALLDVLHAATKRSTTTSGAVDDDYDDATTPLLDLGDVIWSEIELSERVEMVADFRDGAQTIVQRVSSALADGGLGSLPMLLHSLAGKSRDIGAPRLQAYAARRKESFAPAHLTGLISVLEQTLGSMEQALELAVETDVADQADAPALGQVPLVELSLTGSVRDQVIESFCATSLRQLDTLRAELKGCRPCTQLLHSLVSSAASVSATRLVQWLLKCQEQTTAFGPVELEELTALLADTREALGAPGADLMLTTASTPTPAAPPQAVAPITKGLFVAGIDDSLMSKMVQEKVLFPKLKADMAISCCIGVTKEEQLGFLDFVLGHVDKDLQPLQPPFRQADIVTVDQHIDLGGKPHVLGTNLVARLREVGFTGAACIISGGNAVEVAGFEAMPGVDVAATKSSVMGEGDFVARLLEVLAHRRAEQAGSLGGKGRAAKDHTGGTGGSLAGAGDAGSIGGTANSRASSEGASGSGSSDRSGGSGAGTI